MAQKISFTFKKKTETRQLVKPEDKPKPPEEEYISGIEDLKIKNREAAGASKSSLIKPSTLAEISDKEPTLHDYEQTPVEGFGLALLRGMGWNKNDKEIKPSLPTSTYNRPEGAGIGYKSSGE